MIREQLSLKPNRDMEKKGGVMWVFAPKYYDPKKSQKKNPRIIDYYEDSLL
jgi:hypothetical protein